MILTRLINNDVYTICSFGNKLFYSKQGVLLDVNSKKVLENCTGINGFLNFIVATDRNKDSLSILNSEYQIIKKIEGYFTLMGVKPSDHFLSLTKNDKTNPQNQSYLLVDRHLNIKIFPHIISCHFQNYASIDDPPGILIKNIITGNEFRIFIEDFEKIFPFHTHKSSRRKDNIKRQSVSFTAKEDLFLIKWANKGGVLYNSKGEVVWSKYDHFTKGTDDHEFLYYSTYQNLGEGKFDYQAGNVVKKMDLLTGEEVASFNLGAFSQAHYNSPTKITAGALNFVTDKYYVTIGDDSRILVFDKKTMDLIDYHQHRGAMITSYHGWIKILGDKIYILDYAQDLYEYEINRDYSQQLALDKAGIK